CSAAYTSPLTSVAREATAVPGLDRSLLHLTLLVSRACEARSRVKLMAAQYITGYVKGRSPIATCFRSTQLSLDNASLRTWRFSAFFMKAGAVALSLVLVT